MNFYTSVNRIGNSILYRGVNESGAPVQIRHKFEPTLHLISKNPKAPYRSLDGQPLDAIKLDSMSEARDFLDKYKDVENFSVYGNTNYIHQFITEKFPKEIKFDPSKVNVVNKFIYCNIFRGK